MNTPTQHKGFAKSVAGLFAGVLLLNGSFSIEAATFPGNASLTVSDPSSALSWNSTNAALTVQCWFKISIPSGTNLTQNMTILVNGNSGSESQYAYLVRFNISNGNVEFVAQGASGPYSSTLIQLPYLERWYHLAIVRQAAAFTGYVDGRQVFNSSGITGNTANSSGISIGGWGSSQYLYGEVQEVSIYQSALSQDFIVQYMFDQQPTNDTSLGLAGYFPIGYSTNSANELANFAPAPVPSGTASASQRGGMVTFEQTDEGGEQSSFDAQRNGGRDALVPLSGAFSWQQTAFARPTPGIAMEFKYGYSSGNNFGGFQLGGINPYSSGSMGAGWRQTFETRVLPAQTFSPLSDADTVGLMRWDGSIDTWDLNYDTGEYGPRNGEYKGELVITTTNCQWTTPERLVYVFHRPDSGANTVMRGRLTSIHDFNGNSVQILWNQTKGVITQVVDSVNGVYNFNYQNNLLTNVTFGSWQVNFAYDATNRLISKSITNTSGLYTNVNTTWQFQYGTNGLLAQIIDPRGNTNVFIQYDQYGRQTNQVDALGRATANRFNNPGERQITRIDPGTNSWVETYDRKGRMLAQQDPLGNITSYTYDTNGNRTGVTEPLGYQTFFGYDSRANVIARTNALNQVSRWVMHPFFNKAIQDVDSLYWTNFYAYDAGGNLTNQADALGSLVSYTYSTNGLVNSSTDANGHISHFGYDTNGFIISQTDAATNTTLFGRNDVGWKLAETNALLQVTVFCLDLNGRAVRTVDPLLRAFTSVFDADGNLLSATDGKGQLTQNFYDLANQKNSTIDRAGATNSFTYDSRGNLVSVTNALGYVTSQIYDAANRQISAADPLGNTVSNIYNNNGKLIAFLDKTGQRWTKNYDRLNRVIAENDPLGNARQTVYDIVGRVQSVITPNGFPSTNSYDGRGRLVTWNDPQGYKWQYDYDGVANITNITDVLHGHYVMTYGPRNERLTERNQDNFTWQYTYDPLLRLATQTDPNNTVRTLNYDVGGRMLSVGFSTGRINSFGYDNNNNPTNLIRAQSGVQTTLHLDYDLLDRVTNQYDTATFQHVQYAYDQIGRRTSLTYPFGKQLTQQYDALNRLTNQVDWTGHHVSYSYDQADRLISRTYPNGIVQNNTFDAAGRVTGLSYSSINVALSYAYDRNGNKTSSTENGTFNWPAPTLTDENANFTPAGWLINRAITQPSTNNAQLTYHYDPSGNMTNAVGNGQSWAFTYDEDNRVLSVNWDTGITAKNIVNRYDALGRRVAKTVDSATTQYVLDLSGGMERILCDLNSDATVAYYIHGPDLCYKLDDNGNITCFHADAQGNIIALTGSSGTNLAQYAYTAYGRSLGSINLSTINSQPYTFVGSQGVMEELAGLYFMRARYYSADVGVFLSTDPVKKIGPGWNPIAYIYAESNPVRYTDPSGAIFAEGFSSAGVQGQAAFGHLGRSFEIYDQPSDATSYVASRPVYGLGINAGLSVDVVGIYGGAKEDWNDYDKVDFDLGFINLTIAHSPVGGLGISLGATEGLGFGVIGTRVTKSDEAAIWNRQNPGSLLTSTGPSRNTQPTANRTVDSSIQPSTLNAVQVVPKSSPTGNLNSTYTITSGDTLGKIAALNHTTVAALAALNHISHPDNILAGATIKLH